MNTRELAHILMNIPSVGGERTKKLLSQYDGGEPLPLLRELYPFLKIENEILDRARARAEEERKMAERAGIAILHMDDPLYPKQLLSIGDYPPILFARGDFRLLDEAPAAALVGSRRADESVLRETEAAGSLLTCLGYRIVSGLASGCDTAAHRSALKSGGTTLAVMPCGCDYLYPRENLSLFHRMLRSGGLLLSEYGPSVPPAPFRFVRRDRLQSGLARIVVLMESSLRGGAMYTAAAAEKQGRPLFVFKAKHYSPQSQGNKYLIETGRGIPFGKADELMKKIGDCKRSGDQILFSYE